MDVLVNGAKGGFLVKNYSDPRPTKFVKTLEESEDSIIQLDGFKSKTEHIEKTFGIHRSCVLRRIILSKVMRYTV